MNERNYQQARAGQIVKAGMKFLRESDDLLLGHTQFIEYDIFSECFAGFQFVCLN